MVFIKSIVSSFIAFTAVSAIPTELKPRAAFTLSNGQAAQALNKKFATLTANSACNAGENACVGGQFAQCAGGKFAVTGCAGGLKCFALPLVNSAGTSITCDTEADALARIANTGATGGITGGAAAAAAPAAGAAAPAAGAGATNGAAKKGKGKKKGGKKGAKKTARDDHDADEEIDALIHELESHLATRDISDQFDVESLTVEDLDALLEGLQRRHSVHERRGGVPPNVLKTLLNVIKSIFSKKVARGVDEFDGEVSIEDLEALVDSLERRHHDIERRGGVPPNVLQSLLNVIKGIFSKKKVARDIVESAAAKRDLADTAKGIFKSLLDKLLAKFTGKKEAAPAPPAEEAPVEEAPTEEAPATEEPAAEEPAAEEPAAAKRDLADTAKGIFKSLLDKLIAKLTGKGAAAPPAEEAPAAEEPAAEEAPAVEDPAAATRRRRRHARDFTPIVADE